MAFSSLGSGWYRTVAPLAIALLVASLLVSPQQRAWGQEERSTPATSPVDEAVEEAVQEIIADGGMMASESDQEDDAETLDGLVDEPGGGGAGRCAQYSCM